MHSINVDRFDDGLFAAGGGGGRACFLIVAIDLGMPPGPEIDEAR